MKKEDYKYTYRFLHSYGNKVVVKIKDRIRKDKLIDTGALLHSIDYEILDKKDGFNVLFKMGDGKFVYGSGLPSEYGVYQDQGTIYIDPHYFFSAPVPGFTSDMFIAGVKKAMTKDLDIFLRKELKKK